MLSTCAIVILTVQLYSANKYYYLATVPQLQMDKSIDSENNNIAHGLTNGL